MEYLGGNTSESGESCIRNLFSHTEYDNWNVLLDALRDGR
jgi:hypothetical protein